MPTLQERFADLAEDAPVSPTPAGIWTDGRRRARRRRVGTAVIAVVTLVGLLGVGGVSARSASEPGYAGSATTPALPTQIHHPSPWLQGTGGQPPGRLSMLIPAKRGGWPHYHWGTVGVSATTGAYHYLDIPGCFQAMGLSPDGLHVWCFTGADRAGREQVSGVLVYDVVHGLVYRWTPTPGTLRINSVDWNGNDELTFRAAQASYEWRFGYGDPRPIKTRITQPVGVAGSTGLYSAGPQSFFYLDPARDDQRVDVRLSTPYRKFTRLAVSPSGRSIATAHLAVRSSQLLVGTVDRATGRATIHPLATTLKWPWVIGWADDQHLLVVDQETPSDIDGSGVAGASYALARVDVRTGQVVRLAGMADQGASWVTFASSMLGAPTHDFPAPPTPINQRLELGLVVGFLVLGGLALVVWRRRVHA
jgi:hypothetical protein